MAAAKKRKWRSTDQKIGENLRRLRLASDLGQADLAKLLSEWWQIGELANWTRDTVASVEAGRRSVTIDELLNLAGFFEVGVIEFFQQSDGTTHELTRGALLTPPMSDLRSPEEFYRYMREVADGHLEAWHHMHNPTPDIAKRLDVKPAALERAAKSLWGKSVRDEYWARLDQRAPTRMPRRSLAIVRGHVVRGIQKELAAKLKLKTAKEA